MRNSEYQFVDTDSAVLVAAMISKYESIMGVTVQPGSVDRLLIQWLANVVLQERAQTNRAGNQNIPSRASGVNLDAIAELFYDAARPDAKHAVCTVRFSISSAIDTSILIPAGTRVTDSNNDLTWELTLDTYVPIGETSVEALVRCQTPGIIGNGYTPGQINTVVDLYQYCAGAVNITESEGGADAADDDEFYDLMRQSLDAISAGGAKGSYIYWAKSVSTEIADVAANSPSDGTVAIYVLMADGSIAGEEMKAAVLEACNQDYRRPLTDHVTVEDPEQAEFNIELTYYIKKDATMGSADIEAAVQAAVQDYIAWQCGKLGRDINPDELVGRIRDTGNIKRVVLTSPTFTVLADGSNNNDVPQVAKIGTVTLTNGGFEDE